ncbi:MAG: DJ-1/PfpI family protein [Kofleriaceae bacterium]
MSRVLIVAFHGAQTLDITGPAEVFAAVDRELSRRRAGARRPPRYRIELASVGGGWRVTSSGIALHARDLRRVRPRRDDVIVVAGGEEPAIRRAVADAHLLGWLRAAAPIARRTTSVCSGAFVLAAAGLLDGKRAATHWSACDRLARAFPLVTVDRNAIFVEDGRIWTSAGVTTGIDMALALVERDLGADVADAVAAQLVLYVRRLGFQSQFSDALVAQGERGDPLAQALSWARAHLREVDVDALARRAGLSTRTLHRRCLAVLGTTPAKLLDKLRVERARALLTSARTEALAKTIAADAGFGNAARMQRAFVRELGMTTREYRALHGGARPDAPARAKRGPRERARRRRARTKSE